METKENGSQDDKLRLFSVNLTWDDDAQVLHVCDSNVPGLVGQAAAISDVKDFLTKRILGMVALNAVINTPRENEDLYERIERKPGLMCGKPVIKGTRIPVELIVQKRIEGSTSEMLLDAYPQLSRADIRAALLFASDAINRFRRTARPSR